MVLSDSRLTWKTRLFHEKYGNIQKYARLTTLARWVDRATAGNGSISYFSWKIQRFLRLIKIFPGSK